MSSPAPKQAESEFDDLLGQLVDELAMTPASESGVALVPEPEPEPVPQAHVESTKDMAAEAAAAAGAIAPAAKPDNTAVKVVGIIAGSLTAVAVAALIVFGTGEPEPVAEAPAAAHDESAEQAERAEILASHRAASEKARAEAMLAARAEVEQEYVRVEAARLEAELEEQKSKRKPKRRWKPRSKSRSKSKSKPKKLGTDFDSL